MRPNNLDEFVGQAKLVGSDGLLRRMAQGGALMSLILWGPPGCGKTTLARLLVSEVNADFVELSAVNTGVRKIREISTQAECLLVENGRQTVVFIDELHRFSKSQQDALLPAVETGLLVLIGATTENPSFEVIGPLLSRTHVYVLEPLSEQDIRTIVLRAVKDCEHGLGSTGVVLDTQAEKALVFSSGGDARVALNTLESAAKLSRGSPICVELVAEVLQRQPHHYQKGELHYDLISAYIKSVRASDPDAAVYYLARMLNGGEDPLFIARRLIVLASEDIGLANPYALSVAVAAQQAVHFVGMPEGRIALAEATIFLSACRKSSSAYKAISAALEDAHQTMNLAVPLHLRNAPTKLMKELDYGKGYKYPHDHPGGYVASQNLPPQLSSKRYYIEGDNPTEQKIANRRSAWRKRAGTKSEPNRDGGRS